MASSQSSVRYGVVDDEIFQDSLEDIIAVLLGAGVTFHHIAPKPFSKMFEQFENGMFDGLIIDLRLDLKRPKSGDTTLERADYRGSSLAQEIRTRSTERPILSIPLVLWSATSKLQKSFRNDSSSYDLFDRVYDKVELSDDPDATTSELISLARAYKTIQSSELRGRQTLLTLMRVSEDLQGLLDPLMGDQFKARGAYPAHQYAQFVLNEVIEVPGVLVDESLLAARLGVDKSSPQWPSLLSVLKECEYTGIFSDHWRRWWMPLVNRWWRKIARSLLSLRRATAEQRVIAIKRATGLSRLRKASPSNEGADEAYWFIDEVTLKPIAFRDAIRIQKPRATYSTLLRNFEFSWQDGFYISKGSAENQSYKGHNFTIHPSYSHLED